MAPKSPSLRIGVVDQTCPGWTAAGIYSRMMLRSLESVIDDREHQLFFLSASPPDDLQFNRAEQIRLAPEPARSLRGEARFRHLLRLTDVSDPFSVARKHRLDVLLPLLDVPPWKVDACLIGWIPDFQHVYLAELFSEAELKKRNDTIGRLAARADLIMLSSNAAREDFVALAPSVGPKTRVLSFPSLFAFEQLAGAPASSRTKYNLPEKFVLAANQFWTHKNHRVLIEGAAILRQRGIKVPIAMTGLPVDYRDPSNANLSSLLQTIAVAGLNDQVTILGQVPYADLVDLMRTATVIIQPSRFEGWSTIVQDAKALGRPVICSDIAVHREQAPAALGFFGCDEPEAVADLLARNWNALMPGPDEKAEEVALSSEREFARVYAEELLKLCEETQM